MNCPPAAPRKALFQFCSSAVVGELGQTPLFELVPAAGEGGREGVALLPRSLLGRSAPSSRCGLAWLRHFRAVLPGPAGGGGRRGSSRSPVAAGPAGGAASRPLPGAGSFAGGAGRGRLRATSPPSPVTACRRGSRCWELSTEGGAEGREEAEGRGHLRSPNFLPAFCSHFAPAKLKGGEGGSGLQRMKGRG